LSAMPAKDLKALMLGEPRLTLAVAESLTGGWLQARITAIEGASEFFLGGITAYALEQKVRHLHVGRARAEAVNSVSEAVAREMARGACDLFRAKVGVATTGYAQASGPQGVKVPFAWWAVARRKPHGSFDYASGCVKVPGLSRVAVQRRVADLAFDALVGFLREPAGPRTP
jgi:nicotinamide-nucleotide amidase